jgi:hypothetical protein
MDIKQGVIVEVEHAHDDKYFVTFDHGHVATHIRSNTIPIIGDQLTLIESPSGSATLLNGIVVSHSKNVEVINFELELLTVKER